MEAWGGPCFDSLLAYSAGEVPQICSPISHDLVGSDC